MALLAIVIAHLTNLNLFRQPSVHRSLLAQLQRQPPEDPLNKLLHRTDVTTILDASAVQLDTRVGDAVRSALRLQAPTWCLITRDGAQLFLVSGTELLDWLEELGEGDTANADITESSLRRWTIAAVPERATLRQALDILRRRTVEAVCVYGPDNKGKPSLRGIVTRDSIERFTLAQLDS